MPLRRLTPVVLAAALAACTTEIDPEIARQPIGEFRLEHLVVVVDEPIKGPVSRSISDAALEAAVTEAVQRRLGRFEGAGEYSIGIKVAGYVLAPRAVPVLFAPRSQLFLNVLAYDSTPARLHPEPKQLVVNERAGGDTVIGSGYSQTADEQLAELAENAAIEIERWLRENAGWFTAPPPSAADGPEPAGVTPDA